MPCFEDKINEFCLQFFGYSIAKQNRRKWLTEVHLKTPDQNYLSTKTEILTLELTAVEVE